MISITSERLPLSMPGREETTGLHHPAAPGVPGDTLNWRKLPGEKLHNPDKIKGLGN